MTDRGRIAFVDDEAELCLAAADWLEASGFAVTTWSDPLRAAAEIDPAGFDAVITDLRMPDLPGDRLMAGLRARDPDLPVVLMSAHADVPLAVAALREGAQDFIEKPYGADHLLVVLDRAVDWGRMRREMAALRASQGRSPRLEARLPGRAPAMGALREAIRQLADLPLDLMIMGEVGSGREPVARLIHELSRRGRRPFVALDCAAIPEAALEAELFGYERGALAGSLSERAGRLEFASGGTIYLSEIEALSPKLQMRLHRALRDREVTRLGGSSPRQIDVRLIGASRSDLSEAVAAGRFRQDLGFRLSAGQMRVPALRERPEDIALLYAAALTEAAQRFRRPEPIVTPAELDALRLRPWRGNLPELQAWAERQVLGLPAAPPLRGAIEAGRTSAADESDGRSLAQRVAAYEAGLIAEALREAGGSVALAAERLGLPRRTLNEKISRFGLRDGAGEGAAVQP